MGLVISHPLPTAETTPDVFAQLWFAHFCGDSQLRSPTGENVGKAKPWLAETGPEGSSRFRREINLPEFGCCHGKVETVVRTEENDPPHQVCRTERSRAPDFQLTLTMLLYGADASLLGPHW